MNRLFVFALVALAALPSCRTAQNVAETSTDVVTAPARFVGRKIRGDQNPNAVTEGQPVDVAPPPAPSPRPRTATVTPTPPSPAANTNVTSPKPTIAASQFPIAKPVPGKPGYVFSPYDPAGGYVDVTGYKAGDKMKDPYTDFKKIFVVP